MRLGIKCGLMSAPFLEKLDLRLSEIHKVALTKIDQDGVTIITTSDEFPDVKPASEALSPVRKGLRSLLGGREEVLVQFNKEEKFVSWEEAYVKLSEKCVELERQLHLSRHETDPISGNLVVSPSL